MQTDGPRDAPSACKRLGWNGACRRVTYDGQQSNAAADVEQQRYDAELAGRTGDFDEEPNAERFHQVTVQLTVPLVRRREPAPVSASYNTI